MPGFTSMLGPVMLLVSKHLEVLMISARLAIIANAYARLDDTSFSAIANAIDDTSQVAVVKHWHSNHLAGGGWSFPKADQNKHVSDLLHNLSARNFVYLCGSTCVGEGDWFVDAYHGVCLGLGAALKATGGKIFHPEWAPINRLHFGIEY